MGLFGKKTTDQASAAHPAPASASLPTELREHIRGRIFARIDPADAVRFSDAELTASVTKLAAELAAEQNILLNEDELRALGAEIVDELVGLGPIEPLLSDPSVTDILVNGPLKIYAERRGKLERAPYQFRSDAHILHVAQRIASTIGRHIDESSPMLDARLPDGSRVNVIIPPLSVRGACISIRKFSRSVMDFQGLIAKGTVSAQLASALEIGARCRLNIIISGGTGSGKTTLLNTLSKMIDPRERVITIEDVVELQLQQEHVIPLETRPPDLEGRGEVTQRDLMRNALRMRPDRIIIGEVRGAEAYDMMQAMNTGHNGSMSTVHANSARDALSRIENMILMGAASLPIRAIRAQIASALDLVVQIERMRDGVRRVTEVMEIVGLEGDVITLGPLFVYQYKGENPDGSLRGEFEPTQIRPQFIPRLAYFGLAPAFLAALGIPDSKSGSH